jgi:heptaprenyl diphosphate synthase
MEIRKITQLSMLLSLSVVLNIVENLFPILGGQIPGMKIGIANVVVLFTLYTYGFKDALNLSVLRVFLVGILLTGIFSPTFFFSLSGALISIILMYLFKKFTKLSIIGISIIGAISHSIGQVLMAIIILNTDSVIYYLPWLLLVAIPSGIFIGIISKYMLNNLKIYCQTN